MTSKKTTKVEEVFHRQKPTLIITNDFYRDPDSVKKLALEKEYQQKTHYQESTKNFLPNASKEQFERLLGLPIKNWDIYPHNGSFRTDFQDRRHSSAYSYMAAVCLNEDSKCNLTFWKDISGCSSCPSEAEKQALITNEEYLRDDSKWTLVDSVNLSYNRLVIWDAQLFHCIQCQHKDQILHVFCFDC